MREDHKVGVKLPGPVLLPSLRARLRVPGRGELRTEALEELTCNEEACKAIIKGNADPNNFQPGGMGTQRQRDGDRPPEPEEVSAAAEPALLSLGVLGGWTAGMRRDLRGTHTRRTMLVNKL